MTARPLLSAFRQSLTEAWAGGAGALLPMGFLAGAAVLTPFGIGTDMGLLSQVGPGILWVALALSSLVTMERIFQSDLEDGALDLWIQTGVPVAATAAAKVFAHWLAVGLPLALFAPIVGLMFGISLANYAPTALIYTIGGLAFFFWGGVGAALSATVRRGGLLIALIALPLYVPTAIFGAAMTGDNATLTSAPYLLGATTLFALALAPFAMAAALRLAAD